MCKGGGEDRLIAAVEALDTLQVAKEESEQQEQHTTASMQALASDAAGLAAILAAAGTELDLRPWNALERKMCKAEERILTASRKMDALAAARREAANDDPPASAQSEDPT